MIKDSQNSSENVETPLNKSENDNQCSECNQIITLWCRSCISKRFQQDFDKWTSGNERIDEFIQGSQLEAINNYNVMEWVPYNRLRNVQYFAKGCSGTIYYAIWLDGNIQTWNNKEQNWERRTDPLKELDHENAKKVGFKSPLKENENRGCRVTFENLKDSSKIHKVFLNKVSFSL